MLMQPRWLSLRENIFKFRKGDVMEPTGHVSGLNYKELF